MRSYEEAVAAASLVTAAGICVDEVHLDWYVCVPILIDASVVVYNNGS